MDSSPLDFLKPSTEYASADEQKARLTICVHCPWYHDNVRVCGQCGCVMPLKVKLAHAECPVGSW